MISGKVKGYLSGAMAAAAYGTNPAFAVPLYWQGMTPDSVLLFRYLMGLPFLLIIMRLRGIPLHLHRSEIAPTAILGILMAFSSLALFESYNYMNSGLASTLLFVYPIMVAVLMIFFFHEKFRLSVVVCLGVMTAGLAFLISPDAGGELSAYGSLLVMVSALTYALYIVFVNISDKVKAIPTTKLLFYVLCWGSMVFVITMMFGKGLTLPAAGSGWLNLLALAIIPTVISLACTTRAIQLIGPTPTAILGALEPVSAVILSIIILGQPFTVREAIGGLLIVAAALIVIADKSVDKAILHVRKFFPRRRR